MVRELTDDEKAFLRAVDRNGGYEREAVIAFMFPEQSRFHKGKWSNYDSSLHDLMNMFWYALEYERGKNKLAAAAPDLLVALQGLLDEADLNEVNEETAPKIDAARAAIARAMEGLK